MVENVDFSTRRKVPATILPPPRDKPLGLLSIPCIPSGHRTSTTFSIDYQQPIHASVQHHQDMLHPDDRHTFLPNRLHDVEKVFDLGFGQARCTSSIRRSAGLVARARASSSLLRSRRGSFPAKRSFLGKSPVKSRMSEASVRACFPFMFARIPPRPGGFQKRSYSRKVLEFDRSGRFPTGIGGC